MLNYTLLEELTKGQQRKVFAEKTGLTQSYVTKILDKKAVKISIQTAVKIAKAYNVTLDELIIID